MVIKDIRRIKNWEIDIVAANVKAMTLFTL
jgi:hypothetical protein